MKLHLPRRPPGKHHARPSKAARAAGTGLSATLIRRNMLVSDDGTWAWYCLGPVEWPFKSTEWRDAILDQVALRWSDLAGHRVHLRITSQPVPVKEWAEQLDAFGRRRRHTAGGGEFWAEHLVRTQEQMHNQRLGFPVIYIGIRVTAAQLTIEQLDQLHDQWATDLPDDVTALRRKVRTLTESVNKGGFHGAPADPQQMGRLMAGSVGLGAPVPGNHMASGDDTWDGSDFDAFTTTVHTSTVPFARTTRLRALRDGQTLEHHVAVASITRAGERDTDNPALGPWLAYAQEFPFPVEVSAIVDVLSGQAMAASAERDQRRAESLEEHLAEHDETIAAVVGRAIDLAADVLDEVTTGTREIATRLVAPVRLAVFGDTEDDAMSQLREVIDGYAEDQRIEVTHSYGQWELYREFIPGEAGHANRSHERTMPALFAATAVPNSSSGLGDAVGPYLGPMLSGARRAVLFRPTMGPERGRSGMSLIMAGLGGGKSSAAGCMMDDAVREGIPVIAYDPAGSLAELCKVPHLAPVAQHIDLTGAEPGTLNPYVLVPVPQRVDFDTDSDHAAACREAEQERVELMVDTLVLMLPTQSIVRDAGLVEAIERACSIVGGKFGTNPWQVVHALKGLGAVGATVAEKVEAAATLRGGVLVFPATGGSFVDNRGSLLGSGAAGSFDGTKLLTVITSKGVTPPISSNREDWSRAERISRLVMDLAARYAARFMYADTRAKHIYIDETALAASDHGALRALIMRGARDSRRRRCFFAILSQNAGDRHLLGDQVTNLIGTAFAGRMESADAAADALTVLGIPAGYGYERVLLNLEPGEFLMRDYDRRVGKMYFDLGHRSAELVAALETNPSDVDPDETLDAAAPYELRGMIA